MAQHDRGRGQRHLALVEVGDDVHLAVAAGVLLEPDLLLVPIEDGGVEALILVGVLPLDQKGFLVSTSSGQVHVVSEKGSIAKTIDTHRRVTGTPVLIEDGMLLTTIDGEYFVIPHRSLVD